jgi:signal transduction histidine kinase
MYGRIVFSLTLCGILASACVFFAAEILYSHIFTEARESNVREAEDRLALFDLILHRAELDCLERGNRALLELGRRYPTAADTRSADPASLKALAAELGVSEIYFIDRSGKIARSSLKADLGLDLAGLNRKLAAFLEGLYGTGQVADHGLSQSTLTGAINCYQYHSPKGSDCIIEVSSRIDDAIARGYPGRSYEDLVRLAFESLEDRAPSSFARIVDLVYVNGFAGWSLFQRKVSDTEYIDLVNEAKRGREATLRKPASIIAVKLISPRTGASFPRSGKYYAVFEYNLTAEIRFRIVCIAAVVLACGIAASISFAAMKRSFDRGVAGRIERLRADIARAAEGGDVESFDSYGDDEIGAIGKSVGAMVRTMRDEESRLSAAARMETIGAMASGLAHDFNNILTGIKGTLECIELSLADGEAKPGELMELTALASRTATRGENLVRSLFDLASPRELGPDTVDLAAIAREAAELSRGKCGGEVAIQVEIPDSPLAVKGDSQAILRAVLNLCVNGIQSMTTMRPEGQLRGGILVVRAEARPGSEGRAEAAIVVKDEGVGIAPEERGKILAPFYSSKPRGLGSGIGLAIVLSVAASHGGRLEIESERGRGSAFSLILPLP